jgi:hypothetical protein
MYREVYFWYEMLAILRRLALALTISVAGEQTSIIPLIIFVILAFTVTSQIFLMPYKRSLVNYIEVGSGALALLIFVSGLIFSVAQLEAEYSTLIYSLVVLNIAFCIAVVFVIARYFWLIYRRSRFSLKIWNTFEGDDEEAQKGNKPSQGMKLRKINILAMAKRAFEEVK